jgi:putative hydrolase of the HAD superfamily
VRLVLWDFDGTLAERPGRWGGCIREAATRLFPNMPLDASRLSAALSTGFPWHEPTVPHPHLNQSEAWWAAVEQLLVRACVAAGLDERSSRLVGSEARRTYGSPGSFVLYPDAVPALELLLEQGWHHAILSNHIPELPEIVADLGLSPYFEMVASSATIGYDKPHPMAFRSVLEELQPTTAWMVGDNPDADVAGAEAVGIPAVLVHRNHEHDQPLLEAARRICEQ